MLNQLATAATIDAPFASSSTVAPEDRSSLVQPQAPNRRVTLPGGVLDRSGRRYRAVELRELTGADEEVLCGQFDNGAQQVTALLTRAIARIDGWDKAIDSDLVSGMLIGDRDYLLLRLRQMEIGDRVHEVLRCRARECGKKVDVDFLISELPVRQIETLAASYSVPLMDEKGLQHIARLRLPTGADLEAVAPLIDGNPGAANTRLYARIVESIESFTTATEDQLRDLPLRLRGQIGAFIERTAPGPDLSIDIACPHCGADLSYSFDLHGFFLPSVR